MQASKRAFFSRAGAACAAAAILIGSSLSASAAYAAPSTGTAAAPSAAQAQSDVAAPSVDSLVEDYLAEYGAGNLESIMTDGAGHFTIRTGEPATASPATGTPLSRSAAPTKPSIEDFAAQYGNVTIETTSGPATALADEVVNGQGYASHVTGDKYALCSIGWNGFNKGGDPAVITAGHCTDDGSLSKTELTDATQDDAANPASPGFRLGKELGTFGFSQFGGANNAPAILGTDVAVIDDINPELNQLPKMTDWTTPTSPKDSGPVVTGVSEAVPGTQICKSGRTTGFTCGSVLELGIFSVGGKSYPTTPGVCEANADAAGCDDLRLVRGFASDLVSAEGDSGGAIFTGTTTSKSGTAVGMVSAGGKTTAGDSVVYGVSLTDALNHTDGYTVKIFLNAPKLTTTDPIFRSTDVTGTVANAPAGTTVTVTIDGKPTTTTVEADGTWTVKAPNKIGTFDVTAQAANGYSTSETSTGSIKIIKQTLAVPAITAPAQDSKVAAPVTTITGTGKPGAAIELTGDVTGNPVVDADGTWSFTVSPALKVGNYAVTAKQTLDNWNDSKTVTNKFNVLPAAPAVTSPTDGQEFAYDQGPSVLSGTNIADATVSVDINGVQLKATVSGTTWSVALGEKLKTGEYSVSVVQSVDGVESLTGTSAFKVSEAPAPAPTTEPAPVVPAPTTDPAPTTAPTTAPNENDLANTGVSNPVMLLGASGGVLLIGGIAFLLFRRRNCVN